MAYFDNLQSRFNALKPRSYVSSSNSSETLILKSDTIETRLSFSNLSTTFVQSASNNSLFISRGSCNLLSIDNSSNAIPQLSVYGTVNTSNLVFASQSANQIIFQQSGSQYAGLGYNGDGLYYQVPSTIGRHIFQSGAGVSAYTQELMRVQSTGTISQVGIGLTGARTIDNTVSLRVGGNTQVDGNLVVFGGFTMSNAFTGASLGFNIGQRFAKDLMPTGLVYLTSNNLIDDSLLPAGYNFQFMKAMKNVGIGTLKPQQKLHIQGTAIATGRFGAGIITPIARIHAVENSASIPTVVIQNTQSGNVLEAYSANTTPVFFVHPGAVSVCTNTPAPQASLTVNGNLVSSGTLRSSNIAVNGLIITDSNTQATFLTVQDFNNGSQTVKALNSFIPILSQSPVYVNTIQPLSGATVNINSGLTVAGRTQQLKPAMFTMADNNNTISKVGITNAISKLQQINGYMCSWDDGTDTYGLIAQEVTRVLPQAVQTLPNGRQAIQYEGIIALLVQAVKELANK